MSKDITPSVQVLGLSQAVPSKDMSRPNINTDVKDNDLMQSHNFALNA